MNRENEWHVIEVGNIKGKERERERGDWQVKRDGGTRGRGVVQLEDPSWHDRMREFNFFGPSIISSAPGLSQVFSFFYSLLSRSIFSPRFWPITRFVIFSRLLFLPLSPRRTRSGLTHGRIVFKNDPSHFLPRDSRWVCGISNSFGSRMIVSFSTAHDSRQE